MRWIFGTLLLACSLLANAQDLKTWGKETMHNFALCSVVGSAARIMGTVAVEDITKSQGCVEGKIQGAKESFQAVVQQRPAANAAVKEFFAAWIAAMKALPGALNMSNSAAEKAYSASKQHLDELWARVEIEAGV